MAPAKEIIVEINTPLRQISVLAQRGLEELLGKRLKQSWWGRLGLGKSRNSGLCVAISYLALIVFIAVVVIEQVEGI